LKGSDKQTESIIDNNDSYRLGAEISYYLQHFDHASLLFVRAFFRSFVSSFVHQARCDFLKVYESDFT